MRTFGTLRATSRRAGFSFIEVMMVVAIASILASIAIPSFLQMGRRARLAEKRIVMTAITRDVYNTYAQTSRYPWGTGPGSTSWNPPLPTNGIYARAKWDKADPTWNNVTFATDQPLNCRYLVHSGVPETVLYVDMKCDLDADGNECTYSEGFSMRTGQMLTCVGTSTPDPDCGGHTPESGATMGDNDCAY